MAIYLAWYTFPCLVKGLEGYGIKLVEKLNTSFDMITMKVTSLSY